MLNIAIFGPPGAGKGTQSAKIVEKYNLTYIATGNLLREEIASGSKLGKKVEDIIQHGGLVSENLILEMLEEHLFSKQSTSGFLFDGFPRTRVQAYMLDGMLMKINTKLNHLISLEVPQQLCIDRLIKRGLTSGRSDDNEKTIKNRLIEYGEETEPVMNFYKEKGIYRSINGVGTIEEIFKRIEEALGWLLRFLNSKN